jgi:hypothetical protein
MGNMTGEEIEALRKTGEYPTHPWGTGRPQSCWRSLRIHRWGDKRGWFSGLHWFKVCKDCKAMRRTLHVNCDINCATGAHFS